MRNWILLGYEGEKQYFHTHLLNEAVLKMINYSEAYINKLVVHRVGNKAHNEGITLSEKVIFPEESLRDLLTEYFLKPFTRTIESYQFLSEEDSEGNIVQTTAKSIFKNQNSFLEKSEDLLQHLYNQSNHPHIKSGDLFIVLFGDLLINDELVDGIGIFKSEDKIPYLNIAKQEGYLEVEKKLGISIRKLDKGCLILNTDLDSGGKIFSVDNNSYDTHYWISGFLQADHYRDNNFETRSYMEMCRSFSEEIIREKESKKEQIDFLNQSVAYFEENDQFGHFDFQQTVFKENGLKNEFRNFKTNYEEDNGLVFSETFEISPVVLKKQKKAIKNWINLDTNIQIRIDFNHPDAMHNYLEKGWDEDKKMYYYKVYFNEEMN